MLYFESSLLKDSNVRHAFFSRRGGSSSGLLSSLNFRKKCDTKENIIKNQNKVIKFFGVNSIKTVNQVHSPDPLIINNYDSVRDNVNADSIVTNLKGMLIAVETADCCPLLLAEPDNKVIAAIHAGWRGAFTGIIESTISAMIGLGAKTDRILVALGPTISQETYEVDTAFYNSFIKEDKLNERFFISSKNKKHYMFDLPGYILMRLEISNIENINADNLGLNTYTDESNFFSCRRAYHKGEAIFGTQISAITM
jgi:polyphenol oxidase